MNSNHRQPQPRRPGRGMVVGLLALLIVPVLVPRSVTAQVTSGPPRVRYVYIPSDQLQVLFTDASRGVLMDRAKFLSLWQQARHRAESPSAPPVDVVLAGATYASRLDEHALRITGRIQIAKLRPGWQAIDLPFGGLAIESARIGGQPARLGRRDDTTICLVLEEQGRFELELELSAPLVSREGNLATTLRLPPVPASELTIGLEPGKRVQIGDMFLVADGTDHNQQVYRLAIDQTGLIPLVISDRSAGGNRAPLVFASSRSTGYVEPAGLRWQVDLDLTVYARATDTFHLQLPDSVEIAEIEAPQLAHWTIEVQADGTRTMTLGFRKPFLGPRAVRLLGLASVPWATKWEFPTLEVQEAAAHVGQVLVHAAPSLRVEIGSLMGIRPERLTAGSHQASTEPRPAQPGAPGGGHAANSSAASPPDTTSPPDQPDASAPASPQPAVAPGRDMVLAFSFWDEQFHLPLHVTPRQGTLQASVATLVEVARNGVFLRSGVTLAARHAPVFAVELQLPFDWDVTAVLAAGRSVDWDQTRPTDAEIAVNAPGQTLRLELPEPLAAGRSLELTLSAEQHPGNWLEQDETFRELPLPELRLVGADEVEGTLLIQAPPDIELLTAGLSEDLRPVAAEPPASGTDATSGTALQYRYQDNGRVHGRLQVRARRAKVSGETLAFVRLDHDKLNVHYQLDLHIEHGKIRAFGFSLPVTVGQKVQIVPVDSEARVIEQHYTPCAEPAEEGQDRDLWQVVLDRPVTGDLTLAVNFEQPFTAVTADPNGTPPAASTTSFRAVPMGVPVLALRGVARQSGIVALEAASDQQIDYEPENLRDLDPADVPPPRTYVPSQRIVAAYQYQRLPYRLALSATRHASESVLNGLCESADIVSVADRSGQVRHQARFWLRSANLQALPVTLPENADLWTVMLDGEPVEVRRQQQRTYIVPLPPARADSAQDVRELTLLYETRSSQPSATGPAARLWSQPLDQQTPEISLTTLGTTWHVYPPDGTDLVATRGDFQPVTRLTRPTLVSRLAETIVDHSTLGWSWKLGSLVLAAIAVGLFALFNTGKGCANSLTELLVVVVVIGLLISLLLPATQSAREAARRMQCSNNLKQIGLALHNYHDVYKQFPPATIGPHDVPRERQFSWIVAILPFLEQQNLFDALQLDLPWDHPQNAAVLQTSLPTIFCPSNISPSATQDGFARTSYVAITGADATEGWGGLQGVIGLDTGLSLGDITDGTSNTLIVAEVTDGGPWFAGGTGTARRIDNWINNKTWSNHPNGGNVLFADGSVQFLSAHTEPQILRRLATARAGDPSYDSDSGRATTTPSAPPSSFEGPSVTRGDGERSLPEPADGAPPETKLGVQESTEQVRRDKASAPSTATAIGQGLTWSGKPAPEASVARGERASLSLRVALEPHGEQAIRFQCEGGPGQLVLELQDATFARTMCWFLVALLGLGAWLGRRVSGPRRAIMVIAGLAVSIGLSGLVPLASTPLLDGLLLGSLAAGCLWSIPHVLAALHTRLFATAAASITVAIGCGLLSAANAAEQEPAAQQANATMEPARPATLTLFIPYDPNAPQLRQNQQAFLPYDQYLRLWRQAHPDLPNPLPPEAQGLVSHAEYSGQLDNDVARFVGRLVVHHTDNRWTRIPLPLGDVTLEKIELDGQPAALADGQPALYVQPPGLHLVDVRFRVPVDRLGATGQLVVPLRAVASGRLLFQLPADDLDVHVGGCPGGWRRLAPTAADDGAAAPAATVPAPSAGALICVPLGAAGDLSVRWQPRRAAARADQLVSVDQALLAEVRDSGLHVQSMFHYQIQQGAVETLTLRVPPDLMIRDVQGAEVADWSMAPDPEPAPAAAQSHLLVISLKSELSTGTDVRVDCYRHQRSIVGTIDLPALEPLGVVRETGRLALSCAPQFQVRVEQANRLDQIDHLGLTFPLRPHEDGTLFAAYRYNARPWRLQLQVTRQQPHFTAAARTAVAVAPQQITLRSLLNIRVTGAPVPSFDLQLPAALRVTQVRVPSGGDWFVERSGTAQHLKVEMDQPVLGELEFVVRGSLPRNADQAEFTVPAITLEDIPSQPGQLALYLDDDLEAVLLSDGNAQPIDPALLDDVLRPAGGRSAHYAFRYDAPPTDLRLRLSPAPSRVTGDVTTVVSVREGGVTYASKVDFDIRQAGRARFRVTTPVWLGDDIEFRGRYVRQVLAQIQDQDQRRVWEIELQQPVRGTYRLQLLQTLPLSDTGTVPAAIIRPLDVERARSHVVLENLTPDEITATTTREVTATPVSSLPGDLTDNVRRQAVAAYRVTGDDAELTWQRRVREQESGLVATINLADLTTVVHADGNYQARAAYNIRNFTLQFLELELPTGSQVWSVHVSGQPVRPARLQRDGRRLTLLPLQKTSAGDFSSKVVVIYSGHLETALNRWTRISPPAPTILSDVPVSRTLWTLLLPSDYQVRLVGGESNVEEVEAAYQQQERKLSFLDELRQMLQVASTRSKSAASTKARDNLKQVGSALQNYAQQGEDVATRNAADVQQQAQQIEADIQRLEGWEADSERMEASMEYYFQKLPESAVADQLGAELDQSFAPPPKQQPPDQTPPPPTGAAAEPEAPESGHPDQQRDQLRAQAAVQLERLQTMQRAAQDQQQAESRESAPVEDTAQGKRLAADTSRELVDDALGEVLAAPTNRAVPDAAVGTGTLSLDLDLALVGTAYHFRKLHGDPRLVVSARQENLTRLLIATLWAAVCLVVAGFAIYGLRRPHAAAFAARTWPWFAALTGAAWLFLLPAGVFGWVLLVTSLCVLIARARARRARVQM